VNRLRAVRAVLGAATRLDGDQLIDPHNVGIVVKTMDLLGLRDQIQQRRVEYLFDLGNRPIRAGVGGHGEPFRWA
jgi:hypothetical protein